MTRYRMVGFRKQEATVAKMANDLLMAVLVFPSGSLASHIPSPTSGQLSSSLNR